MSTEKLQAEEAPGMGKVHCAECENPIAYFKPESMPEQDLELYCESCAVTINGGKAIG